MSDETKTSENAALHKAMFNMMAEIPAIPKRGKNPFTKSQYILLDDLVNTLWPLARKHGLVILQFPSVSGDRDNVLNLETIIRHAETGQEISNILSLPLGHWRVEYAEVEGESGEAIKTGTAVVFHYPTSHELGGGITYLRRYSLAAMFGIVSEADDDGNTESQSKRPEKLSPRKKTVITKTFGNGGKAVEPAKKLTTGAKLEPKDFKELNDYLIKLTAEPWKVSKYLREKYDIHKISEITYDVMDDVKDQAERGFFGKEADESSES